MVRVRLGNTRRSQNSASMKVWLLCATGLLVPAMVGAAAVAATVIAATVTVTVI